MANVRFFVHIIESPSPADLLDGRTEGNTLCSFLKLAEIPHLYNLVVDKEQLQVAFTTRLADGAEQFDAEPIIHISAHGNQSGIQITGQWERNQLIDWKELADYLAPINRAIDGNLGVCMSACGGANARTMAKITDRNKLPFGWVVGTEQAVHYCDAALAFVTFYRGLHRGLDENQLIAAMRAASGVNDFGLDYGHVVQKQYKADYIKRFREAVSKLRK